MTASSEEQRLWRVMERGDRERHRVTVGRVGRTLFAGEPFRPVLVLGPQRSRKTTGLVVPALLEWTGPAVVTSVREDVIEQTIANRSKAGKVFVFDPGNILSDWPHRVGWNPLELISTWDEAKRVGFALTEAGAARGGLTEADFWHAAARQLCAPHLFAAAKNGYTMADVIRWVKTQEEFEVRSLLQATGEELAIEAAEAAWAREDRARSSVYTTLQIDLDVWDHKALLQAANSDSRFHLEEFLNGGTNTLYLCAPPDAQEEYAPIFTALIRAVIARAYEKNRKFASHLLGIAGVEPGYAGITRRSASFASSRRGWECGPTRKFEHFGDDVGRYGNSACHRLPRPISGCRDIRAGSCYFYC